MKIIFVFEMGDIDIDFVGKYFTNKKMKKMCLRQDLFQQKTKQLKNVFLRCVCNVHSPEYLGRNKFRDK
jgi:hypothetical protein